MSQTILLNHIPVSAHGMLAHALCERAKRPVIHLCANDRQLDEARRFLASYAPAMRVLCLPAWDCLPYDRLSPAPAVTAQRLASLSQLAVMTPDEPVILLTTLSAAMQYLPPKARFAEATLQLKRKETLNHEAVLHYLAHHGYQRVGKVMEAGEFAVRGSLIDLFAPGHDYAARIDLFGDEIESIKWFDPLTQRSLESVEVLRLYPMNEILLTEESINRFRSGYRERFGAVTKEDPLYEAISHGRHYAGMEHWLPLFYDQLDSVFDYLPRAIVSFDDSLLPQHQERFELVCDYYQARLEAPKQMSSAPYCPLEPEALYLSPKAFHQVLECHDAQHYSTLTSAKGDSSHGIATPPSFSLAQKESSHAPYLALKVMLDHAAKPIILACQTAGSAARILSILHESGIAAKEYATLADAMRARADHIAVCPLALEHGFRCPDFTLLSEQDLLGERVIRTEKRARNAEAFLIDATSLSAGELIVHKEHGIGRFEGLETLQVQGAQHDCLKLVYADDAKLFLPVVNMELISRFGSDTEGVQLDKLGAASWQKRKAAMKQRIKLAAQQLLKIAAKRLTREAAHLEAEPAAYAEFCARFPFTETDDQQRAIDEVLGDLRSGRPMDRLICGDVGFGKTEVALRAAFAAVSGEEKVQVAVIAPTTLLARQHYQTFKTRFEGFPVKVRLLSRLVSSKEQAATREGIAQGTVDIVVGTHALLSKQVQFQRLGMMVVDEEQRFGVAQKERMKQLRANIHVLTLSATPIPRTLQMSLAGVRELSLITTPPVDRLAIRSFVMPFDGVVIKEALLREYHRGGKVFYVTPRIEYLDELEARIRELAPDLKLAIAHGQMPATQLEKVMQEFYDGRYDVLLATTIIESGLDVPSANTIIIDRADMFGLAQLYQLRGRVGRGKSRAYAYLTIPHHKKLTFTAAKRLEVMAQLDSLGAGFTLASHDMDIRGFGNLLGEEQSGHIREVGVELYQHMLEEMIDQLKRGGDAEEAATSASDWSPSINLGSSVLIPESYIDDLDIRMQLYRRLSALTSEEEIEAFRAELIDRFGALPEEVTQLLNVLHIKRLCKLANIERIDTGPKGAVFTFRDNAFPKPEALLSYISRQSKHYKIRQDQKLVYSANWRNPREQFTQVNQAVASIASLAA